MARVLSALLVVLGFAASAAAQVAGPPAQPMPLPGAAPAAPPAHSPAPPAAPSIEPTAPSAGPPAQPMVSPGSQPLPPSPASPLAPPSAAATSAPSPSLSRLGHGLTFEVAFGVGRLHIANEVGDARTYDAGGISLGVGWWISSRNALTVRIASANHAKDEQVSITSSVLGLSLQHWFSEKLWMGGGVGSGVLRRDNLDDTEDPEPERGLGIDLRAGYRLAAFGQHSLSVALEMSPVLLERGSSTALGVLLAYQYL